MSRKRASRTTKNVSTPLLRCTCLVRPQANVTSIRPHKSSRSGGRSSTISSRRCFSRSARILIVAREFTRALCCGFRPHRYFSHAYTFRKEGHTKVIEYDLTSKQKAQHGFIGLKRPNVLLGPQRAGGKPNPSRYEPNQGAAVDSESDSDSESEGDDVFSDNGVGNDLHAGDNAGNLPKSASGKTKTSRGRNERVMAPEECRAHLRRLFTNEAVICSLLFGRHGPFSPLSPHGLSYASADVFFLDVVPVSPTRFRPPAKMNDMLFEHPQNELLTRVLVTSYRLRDLNDNLHVASDKGSSADDATKRRLLQSLLDSLIQLQVDVNSFIDSSKNPQAVRQGKLPPAGVKQLLEKKNGLFRKHMMV